MSWEEYFRKSQNKKPRELHLEALSTIGADKGFAIDLGCGMGIEAVETVKHGWDVLAIDGEASAFPYLEKLVKEYPDLKTEQKIFEEISSLPQADFIYAYHSLPFCHKDYFVSLLEIIATAVKPGGYFSATLFGLNDDWVKTGQCCGIERAQLEKIFQDFKVLSYNEIEGDKPPVLEEKNKHWHTIEIILQRS